MASENTSLPRPWTINSERRAAGLEVVLLKQIYVLPWSQFLYAEGASDHIRAVFTTHDVLMTGTGLSSLLSDFAAQHITQIREPARTEKFSSAGPRLTTLTVKLAEQPQG